MQTDTDCMVELAGSGPIAKELTEEETAIYCSVAKTLVEGKITLLLDSQDEHELNLQSFQLAELVGTIERSQIIFELIEETAIWRKCELPSPASEGSSDDSESSTESDQCRGADDE